MSHQTPDTWVEPGDEFVFEVPVEYVYEDQAYVNSENFAGKMTIPSKSLLSLLASCSLFCYAYATIPTTCFTMPPILPCQTSNPPCPSKPLFGYVTALLSPLIALLVAGEVEDCSMVDRILVGDITISLILLMHLYTW